MASLIWNSFASGLIPVILTLSTSGFTMLFTTSMQEKGIVADNDPLGLKAEILALSVVNASIQVRNLTACFITKVYRIINACASSQWCAMEEEASTTAIATSAYKIKYWSTKEVFAVVKLQREFVCY